MFYESNSATLAPDEEEMHHFTSMESVRIVFPLCKGEYKSHIEKESICFAFECIPFIVTRDWMFGPYGEWARYSGC
jgi:hypothetical protein